MAEKIGSKDGAVKARKSPRAASAKTSGSKTTAPKGRGKAAKAEPKIPYRPDEVAEIFRRFSVQRPEPESELEHSNPFTLLVAVVLSAQATDAGVNKATRGLFASADTPEAMAALGEDAIRDHIKTIGLYRNKAKNVLALSEALIARHGGEVPRDRAALEALPGVGRKTANVVLNVAFGEETLAVDTHIFRIGNRLKLAPGKTPDEVEARLLPIVPQPYRRHAHHWLILHGRYVCKARKPDCGACVIADLCHADEKTNAVPAELIELPARLPQPPAS
ncbi:DNA-(apurinic or apyrimidinic site) lyase /endonuclease III [Fulvimarina manganoxydans]|uniref:Endonuclease III n=1 Tax=Fulvimarina manganoxydans TaxID=937218 RepID=A0A1W2CHF2_9HYPH|nr:endonuclease III [Fulvimarina manganoxydans]SMC84384.1 DNA-(apurinic or apyrimidinic site) lyase /endonuclease III [Fulvimarina manganoxydans]